MKVKFMVKLPGIFGILSIPAHRQIHRRRYLANFLKNVLRSGFRGGLHAPLPTDQDVGSETWNVFSAYIKYYCRYVAPRYLLDMSAIKYTAGGYVSLAMAAGNRGAPNESEMLRLPEAIVDGASSVAEAMARRFPYLDRATVYNWLCRYQLAAIEVGVEPETAAAWVKESIVVELGAGVGAHALVYNQVSEAGVVVFDLPEMIAVQERVADQLKDDVEINGIQRTDKIEQVYAAVEGKPYIVVSFWAYTEFPLDLRNAFAPLIQESRLALFACNSRFEGVENLSFFELLTSTMNNKRMASVSVGWQSLSGHSYVAIT